MGLYDLSNSLFSSANPTATPQSNMMGLFGGAQDPTLKAAQALMSAGGPQYLPNQNVPHMPMGGGSAPGQPGSFQSFLAELLRKMGASPFGGLGMQTADATNPHVMTPGAVPGFAGARAGPPMQPLPSLDRNIYPDPMRANTLYPRMS